MAIKIFSLFFRLAIVSLWFHWKICVFLWLLLSHVCGSFFLHGKSTVSEWRRNSHAPLSFFIRFIDQWICTRVSSPNMRNKVRLWWVVFTEYSKNVSCQEKFPRRRKTVVHSYVFMTKKKKCAVFYIIKFSLVICFQKLHKISLSCVFFLHECLLSVYYYYCLVSWDNMGHS